MKSSYVCTRSSNVGNIDSNNVEMGVLGYEILDSGNLIFRYPLRSLVQSLTEVA